MIVACIGHGTFGGICVNVTYKPVAVFDSLEEADKELTKNGYYKFVTAYFRDGPYPEPHRIDLFEVGREL